jgi:hypothetical protein
VAVYYVSSSGVTGAGTLGDPWSLAHFLATAISGDVGYMMDDGTYSITSILTWANGSLNNKAILIGVNSSGVEDGSRPTIQASAAITGYMVDFPYLSMRNIVVDGNSLGEDGVRSYYGTIQNCIVENCTRYGFDLCCNVWGSTARNNGSSGFRGNHGNGLYYCIAHGNVSTGFRGNNRGLACWNCISYDNDDGFSWCEATRCAAWDNPNDGFDSCTTLHCISFRNSGWGYSSCEHVTDCAYGSGAMANTAGTASGSCLTVTPALIDAGATFINDLTTSPFDWRTPAASPLYEMGPRIASNFYNVAREAIGPGPALVVGGGGATEVPPYRPIVGG